MLSVFNNKQKLYNYISMWLAYGLAHFYIYSAFTSFSFVILLVDALLFTFLYAVTGVLLMYILKYAGLGNLNVFQRNLNYFGMFVIAITIVVGISYVIANIFADKETFRIFQSIIPLRIFCSLLIYSLIVCIYSFKLNIKPDEIIEETVLSENEDLAVKDENSESKEYIDRIAVKSGQKINVIPVHEIYCMKAESDYVQIFTEKGKYLKEQTMKFFEENLQPSKYVRVHRSYIINIDAISRIELYEKQTQQLTLKNGMQIRMSQAGYKLLKDILKL